MKKVLFYFLLIMVIPAMLWAYEARVEWDAYGEPEQITGFILYFQEAGNSDPDKIWNFIINEPTSTRFPLNPVYFMPGKSYVFWMTAYNDLAESAKSNTAELTVPAFQPDHRPPPEVISIPGPIGGVQIHL